MSDFIEEIEKRMAKAKEELKYPQVNSDDEIVVKLDPKEIANWEFRDRREFELGDLNALAESIETNGQAQPIILVRASSTFKSKGTDSSNYIVIAGYRRWLACKQKSILVEGIVKDLTFNQAISYLYSENEKEAVSDYSKGFFFSELLSREKITKKDLYERLGMKRSMFNNYLSFSEVPQEIWDAVGDVSKISARTAGEINLIASKGVEYIEALISIASKIKTGIGAKNIQSLVDKIIRFNDTQKTKMDNKHNINGVVEIQETEKWIKISSKKMPHEAYEELKKELRSLVQTYVDMARERENK